jgi:GNAT superfamily N-acetyltransferase
MKINIRKAENKDWNAVHKLIQFLAKYEKEPEAVITSAEQLLEDNKIDFFDCIVAEINSEIIGMALYHKAYSTWKGKMLYLEDLYVLDEYRNNQVGQKLFDAFKDEAKKLNCVLIKWQVLDWNETAIKFYEKNGATIEKNWWNGKMFLQ